MDENFGRGMGIYMNSAIDRETRVEPESLATQGAMLSSLSST